VQSCLRSFYHHPKVTKGAYDLVLWRIANQRIRFIEVNCPHWDKITVEQQRFAELAKERGKLKEVIEWELQ
jgi:hypothetical protein